MRRNQFKFTLVELLVSLGVFSIMLVLFMQFFSGMQKVWSESDNRGQLYNRARIAMDIISKLVNAMVCSTASEDSVNPKKFFFRIRSPKYTDNKEDTSSDFYQKNRLYFTSCGEITSPDETDHVDNTKFYSLQISGNKLMLTTLTNAPTTKDPDSSWYSCFFTKYFNKDKIEDDYAYDKAFLKLIDILNGKLTVDNDCRIELLPMVTKLEIKAYKRNGEQIKLDEDKIDYNPNTPAELPYELEICISLLGDKDYAEWQSRLTAAGTDAAKKKNVAAWRSERERTFVRRIFLGDRCSVEDKYEKFPL